MQQHNHGSDHLLLPLPLPLPLSLPLPLPLPLSPLPLLLPPSFPTFCFLAGGSSSSSSSSPSSSSDSSSSSSSSSTAGFFASGFIAAFSGVTCFLPAAAGVSSSSSSSSTSGGTQYTYSKHKMSRSRRSGSSPPNAAEVAHTPPGSKQAATPSTWTCSSPSRSSRFLRGSLKQPDLESGAALHPLTVTLASAKPRPQHEDRSAKLSGGTGGRDL
mmetsp:Transcript_36795/g.88107  ORF Transcript_36795/g.88107 Transcript_36795/m.88107 type:complete len:214 (-) Transcript_36795:681-1322(-)